MAISVFPVASASTGPNTYSATIPASKKYKTYDGVIALQAGVYTVTTSPTSTQAIVTFYDSTNAPIATVTTVSGSIAVNLATEAKGAFIKINSDTETIVSIALTANALTGTAFSGTVDTITSTGTYNQTGALYVLAIGGGGGGQAGWANGNYAGGQGGFGGASTSGYVLANTSTSVTIGAAGTKGRTNLGQGNQGNGGGTTTFGNTISAAGGAAGYKGNTSGSFAPSEVISTAYDMIVGNNGGGGDGAGSNGGGANSGAGSGIGTGGRGGNTPGGAPTAATGYGAGGGGGGGNMYDGGDGTAGVVYVLRGFKV